MPEEMKGLKAHSGTGLGLFPMLQMSFHCKDVHSQRCRGSDVIPLTKHVSAEEPSVVGVTENLPTGPLPEAGTLCGASGVHGPCVLSCRMGQQMRDACAKPPRMPPTLRSWGSCSGPELRCWR